MSTHTYHHKIYETWFCTITCYKWLSLFEESNGYDAVYNWFDALLKNCCILLTGRQIILHMTGDMTFTLILHIEQMHLSETYGNGICAIA